MADFVFNDALGRVAQWCQNVEDNDPAASVLRMHAWVNTAADSAARDVATITLLEAVTNVAEASNSGYANILMDPSDIVITVDDSNERVDIVIGDQTFTSVVAGDVWTDITISYDPDGSDTDTTTFPMTQHDFAVTPNGGDITADEPTLGFFRAS